MTTSGKGRIRKEISTGAMVLAAFFFVLFFRNISDLGSLEGFSGVNLNANLDRLSVAWEKEHLPGFLREKQILRRKLNALSRSETSNESLQKEVLSVIAFMFPEDVSNRIFVNHMPAAKMRSIEKAPSKYQANLEFARLEIETYLDQSGIRYQRIPETHQKILSIYKKIAGLKSKNPEESTP